MATSGVKGLSKSAVGQMHRFYRAMHCSAKRGLAIACRLSVRLFVSLSVSLMDCDGIVWNSSKIISRLVSLACDRVP